MASAGRPRGFDSDPPTGSSRAKGSPHNSLEYLPESGSLSLTVHPFASGTLY